MDMNIAVFIDNNVERFMRESNSHLAGFFYDGMVSGRFKELYFI